jgi:hypothetical protein
MERACKTASGRRVHRHVARQVVHWQRTSVTSGTQIGSEHVVDTYFHSFADLGDAQRIRTEHNRSYEPPKYANLLVVMIRPL